MKNQNMNTSNPKKRILTFIEEGRYLENKNNLIIGGGPVCTMRSCYETYNSCPLKESPKCPTYWTE